MEFAKHLATGVAANSINIYQGRHRDLEMPQGYGYFPMGDRNRCRPELNELEERQSIDKYTKYHSS